MVLLTLIAYLFSKISIAIVPTAAREVKWSSVRDTLDLFMCKSILTIYGGPPDWSRSRHGNNNMKSSERICFNCGKNTTYTWKSKNRPNPYAHWYKRSDGKSYVCKSCHQKLIRSVVINWKMTNHRI